jgi:hypothetical protein
MSDLSKLIAESKGLPAAFRRDHPIGTVWAGKVQRVSVSQVRDDDGNGKTWDDGNPMQQVVVAIETDQRDPEKKNDDGVRGIYVKWWGDQRKAFLEALSAAGVEDIEVGGMFAAQYVGDGAQPANKMFSPPKIYKFEYKAPSGLGGLIGGGAPAAQPQQSPAVEAMLGAPQQTSSPMSGMTAGQPASTPAAAPVSTPPAQPVSPAPAGSAPADPMAQLGQIKGLIGFGLTDEQIAAATGADVQAILAIRSIPA